MAKETEDYKKEIEEGRLSLEEKYALAMTAARKIVQKHEELLAAEEERDLRGGSKDIAKHEIAESLFGIAVKKYFSFLSAYDLAVEKCISLYSELAASACAKEAKKARAEAERLEDRERYRRDKLFDVIRYVNGIDDMYSEYVSEIANKDGAANKNCDSGRSDDSQKKDASQEFNPQNITVSENKTEYQQKTAPFYQANSVQNSLYDAQRVTNVRENYNIPAASIDISRIIEEAVSAAMNKFNSVFDERADAALREYSQKIKSKSLPPDALKMHSELVDFELEIAEKLTELTGRLKVISDQMIEIGTAYMKLSDVQKDIAESQKKANDIQRTLVRRMQGVLANQKVISQEQTAVAEEQAALIERQKLNIERQTALGEQQEAAEPEHSRT